MEPAKFSIILPVRNGGHYVKDCVHSILKQDYAHFNLIVLDNCSTDGTYEWIQELAEAKIVIHPSEKPLTIEENWGRITGVKKNEWMVLIGHDDTLEPDYLSTIHKLIIAHPDAGIYVTHFNFIDASGKVIRPCKPMPQKQSAADFLTSLLTLETDLVGTGFTMRSEEYDAAGGLPTHYPNLLFADLTLYHLLSRISNKVAAEKNCFSFRLHQSTTFTTDDSKFQQAFRLVIDYFLQLKKSDPVLAKVIEENGSQFIAYYCKSLSHRMIKNTNKGNISVKQFVDDCTRYAKQLSPSTTFNPQKIRSIQLAIFVDSNPVGRFLFKMFRKVYAKPLFKN